MPTLSINYTDYPAPQDLPKIDRELLAAASVALSNSYSPYSKFKVGAAALLEDGTIALGWNTENAAYPMCLCAEPAALAAAASLRPGMPVVAMAITIKSPSQIVDVPASPCGSCRQQLSEHESRFGTTLRLILRGETGPVFVIESASHLLPFGFSGKLL